MWRFLSLIFPIFCLSGCSSFSNHLVCWISPGGDNVAIWGIPFGEWGKPVTEESRAVDRPRANMPVVYSGTVINAKFISKAVTCRPPGTQFTWQGLPCQREWTTGERVSMGIVNSIDLPISLVLDTALLPVDIVMASCWPESERAAKRENTTEVSTTTLSGACVN